MRIADIDELPLVMREISGAMGARWSALTMHPTGEKPAEAIFVEPEAAGHVDDDALERLATEYLATMHQERRWHGNPCGAFTVYHIPVEVIAGHARLVITLLFDNPTDDELHRAESVYLSRRPFAIGYFRLWQVNRMRQRHAEHLETALNMTEIGLLLLDRDGEIAFANDTAERILASESGLRRRGQSVRATHMADAVALQIAMEHVLADQPREGSGENVSAPVLALRRQDGAPPLIAAVLPTLTPAVEPSDIAVIMYIVDPQQDVARMLMPLCRLYRLSPIETQLVVQLVGGASIGEIAASLRIKQQTVRGYLRQIFIKTSTNRQTELIVLMLSSLVRMKENVLQEALEIDRRSMAKHHALNS